MFTEKDLKQFSEKGISLEKVEEQIANFKKGFPYADIISAATISKGLVKLNENQIYNFIETYEKALLSEKIVKFVPASGAASRMFKSLFEYMENPDEKLLEDKSSASLYHFFKEIEKFSFYGHLFSLIPQEKQNDKVEILKYLLTEKGLNYGNLPKGLLKFHKYNDDSSRTPAAEHLEEGGRYANSNGKIHIHFTVSPEHMSDFKKHIDEIKHYYETKFGAKYEIEYSIQKPSTDTIAVDMENNPFRNEDGTILFRPGGHGALIENLNDIDADIIFVKNIDNVVPDKLKDDTVTYKKAIAGLLITERKVIFDYIKKLQKGVSLLLIEEIVDFMEVELSMNFGKEFESKSIEGKREYLIEKLNRPIRICGMVKNEGEPGGGPFKVKNSQEFVSMQIVESAQIDLENIEKAEIVNTATHFNPVDLVLSVKDFEGKIFDLTKFVDKETGFISEKSKDGKELKAQELPGLWNGAMANWNTIFVEVPVSTFNPVKIVNDLLREQHQ